MIKKKKRKLGKLKGFSLNFIPYSEIRTLNSTERIRKVLEIVLGNKILILQGRLKAEEETRLIEDTMAMIGHVKNFKGIELAVINDNKEETFVDKIKKSVVNALSGGDLGALTVIGPATIVKDIKRDPKKLELFLSQ